MLRRYLSLAAIVTVVLAATATGIIILSRNGGASAEDPSVERSATLVRPTATTYVRPTATPTRPPPATATPLPPPTSTPVPPPPPPPPTEPPPPPPPPPPESDVASQQGPPPAPPPKEWMDYDYAAQVLALANAERAARGVPALAVNGAFSQSAQSYAITLIQLDTLSHSAHGTDVLARARSAGYGGGPPMGEVLWASTGYLPPERVLADWMASGSHRSILLDPTYRDVGIGCYFHEADLLRARCVMDVAG